jgi:hypothetical protein
MMEGEMAELSAFALGLRIGALLVLAWATIGFVVAVIRFFLTPPPPPPPGLPCSTCTQLQELWDSMSWLEKAASAADFAAASAICFLTGCGWLGLR